MFRRPVGLLWRSSVYLFSCQAGVPGSCHDFDRQPLCYTQTPSADIRAENMLGGLIGRQGLATSSGRRCLSHRSSSSSSSSSSRISSRFQPARLRHVQPLCSSQQEQAELKQALQQQLKKAVAAEDYVAANKIKEQLLEIELKDPLYGLRIALDAAVQEERYQVRGQLPLKCLLQHSAAKCIPCTVLQQRWPGTLSGCTPHRILGSCFTQHFSMQATIRASCEHCARLPEHPSIV
jgi:hypothetical protein